jgi:peptide/nickel transport system substrate-binding protein
VHHPLATRRVALAAGLALPWAARPARAQAPVNVVLESEVVILDPHATTAAITRTFATHVFDTLFAMDGQGTIRPQMVEAGSGAATASRGISASAPASLARRRARDGGGLRRQPGALGAARLARADALGR